MAAKYPLVSKYQGGFANGVEILGMPILNSYYLLLSTHRRDSVLYLCCNSPGVRATTSGETTPTFFSSSVASHPSSRPAGFATLPLPPK